MRLTLHIQRCRNPKCAQFRQPYRPEQEGRLALPKHAFGLDVIAHVGTLRYAHHRSVTEMHHALRERQMVIAPRTVTDLLARYDARLSLTLNDPHRLERITQSQGRVIFALDGLQHDVGHEVLWVLRDCLSGEVLLAQSLLSATQHDVATLLNQVKQALTVPIIAVLSDGPHAIRKAVQRAFPHVPHQLCHFHYLREAATPIYEADRHAKKALKKYVRGVRPLERQMEGRTEAESKIIRGYCSAMRSALTDDGRPPLAASGLKLHDRLRATLAS